MRLSFAAVIVVFGVFGLVAVSTLRAQRTAAGPSTGVALVDVGAIARNSTRLKDAIEAVKRDYNSSAENLKKEGERGNALTEKLRTLPEGPERKQMEQEIVKLRADYELHGKRVNDEASDRESKVFYATARELQEELTKYATASGVQLVLRYEPSPPEFPDQRAIMQEIQKLVVYQRDAEITPLVTEGLNRRVPNVSNSRGAAPAKGTQR